MTGWVRLPPFIVLTLFLGTANAIAQSVGADEAITSQGTVTQTVGLTLAQKSAIYNAIVRQRVRASSTQIEATVRVSARSSRLQSCPIKPASSARHSSDMPWWRTTWWLSTRSGCASSTSFAATSGHELEFPMAATTKPQPASAQSAVKTNNIVKVAITSGAPLHGEAPAKSAFTITATQPSQPPARA